MIPDFSKRSIASAATCRMRMSGNPAPPKILWRKKAGFILMKPACSIVEYLTEVSRQINRRDFPSYQVLQKGVLSAFNITILDTRHDFPMFGIGEFVVVHVCLGLT